MDWGLTRSTILLQQVCHCKQFPAMTAAVLLLVHLILLLYQLLALPMLPMALLLTLRYTMTL